MLLQRFTKLCKALPSRKSAIFQCTFIFQTRLAHLTARSICTPFSLLSDSHTLTRMTTILSNYLGLREMGTLSTALFPLRPLYSFRRAEKDIPDLHRGRVWRGPKTGDPKAGFRSGSPPLARAQGHGGSSRVDTGREAGGGQGQEQEVPQLQLAPITCPLQAGVWLGFVWEGPLAAGASCGGDMFNSLGKPVANQKNPIVTNNRIIST